ncbi:MAG: family 1 glycosylhydrolase [Arcanobacterium sp.]|nr:family 1 glycosylhydrolase [Arcanobacterium sp.]
MSSVTLNFAIGTASAALQIEGHLPPSNWDAWAGRGEVKDGTTPQRTTGHWERWREDNALMSELGLQIARISVEWARIEPRQGEFDEAALARYHEEIADLRARGIAPLVTLHHFGDPIWFESLGGWPVEANVDLFLRYVRHVVAALDDVVTDWITINEPNVFATGAYLFKEMPPGTVNWRHMMATLRNFAVAHIGAYQIIHEIQDSGEHRAKVAFAHHKRVFAPRNPKNPVHQAFTRFDEYMFHRIIEDAFYTGHFSPALGRPKRSVTPGLYADAIGLNYYSRTAVSGITDGAFPGQTYTDLGWEVYPQGIVECVRELSERFPELPIWVTENGTADNGFEGPVANTLPAGEQPLYPEGIGHGLESGPGAGPNTHTAAHGAASGASAADGNSSGGKHSHGGQRNKADIPMLERFRCDFLVAHWEAMAASGLPFERYYHWCFVDNWEWTEGMVPRFGIVWLDRDSLERTPKPSAYMMRDVIKAGGITSEIRARYCHA